MLPVQRVRKYKQKGKGERVRKKKTKLRQSDKTPSLQWKKILQGEKNSPAKLHSIQAHTHNNSAGNGIRVGR